MSRVLKFRGKMNADDWWYVTPDDEEWEHFWALVDRETVGQFTGLLDKQDKEIYEGDIVCLEKSSVGVVGFAYANFYVHVPEYDMRVPFHEMHTSLFEVIGNIYETPELLNKEQA